MTPTGGSPAQMSYRGVGQSWQTQDGGVSYVTGPLGLTKWSNGTTTEYIIRDPMGNPVAIMQAGGQDYYLMTDKNGSITTMVGGDGGADPGAQYSYGPWGNVTGSYDYGPPIPFGFDGGITDPPGGLIKFGERYYDPNTGRWTQQDPIGGSIANPTTINRYPFAGNDPVNLLDRSGMCFLGFGKGCPINDAYHTATCIVGSFITVIPNVGSALAEAGSGIGAAGGGVLEAAGTTVAGALSGSLLVGGGLALIGVGAYKLSQEC